MKNMNQCYRLWKYEMNEIELNCQNNRASNIYLAYKSDPLPSLKAFAYPA